MAHHEASEHAAEAGEAPAEAGTHETEGAVGAPDVLPVEPAGEGGFDFWLLALLVGVAALVAIQNLWLRRRAQRDGGGDDPT